MSGKEASVSNINETEKSGKAITGTEFSSCFNFSKTTWHHNVDTNSTSFFVRTYDDLTVFLKLVMNMEQVLG